MQQAKKIEVPILTIRRQRVMLDSDLAQLYGTVTKALIQAIKRNAVRFPDDFAFQLTAEEIKNLRSQIVTSSLQPVELNIKSKNRSQFATGPHGGRRTRPWVFTEHGALMAANILRSEQAVHMSIYVVRAFVKQREQVVANAAIFKRLA